MDKPKNKKNNLFSQPPNCVMCGERAYYIAEENKEFLCKRCAINNEEARKSYPHKQNLKTFLIGENAKRI